MQGMCKAPSDVSVYLGLAVNVTRDMCKASHTVYVYLGQAVKATWALFYNMFLLTEGK
jgi:hypothetical protein